MNHLAGALSPYLAAYADDPIDWYPWGEEAFAEARRRDVPLMISIGYSTCHWCHVMARESFSDPAVGALVDTSFVAVKVDREEHPDVDAHYLRQAAAFVSGLGWPLTVFATPQGAAFFAGTYFPPTPRGGAPAFRDVLAAVTGAWQGRRTEVEQTAAQLIDALAVEHPRTGGPAGAELVDSAITLLASHEDRTYGGFGDAPKFPVAPVLRFLLQADRAHPGAADPALRTLDAVARSALRDPIEGGFFRYATRRDWGAPHYERMLFDNAGLLGAYADAARVLRRRGATVPHGMSIAVDGIAGFLRDVLATPGGGFAAAQDSESDIDGRRTEGGYFGLDAAGRASEPTPAVDRKVLTGWNGLAIGALAEAALVFGRPDFLALAVRAAEAVSGSPLLRGTVGGQALAAPATLEDVGLLANGLTTLFLATGDPRWACRARELVDEVITADGAFVPPAADPLLAPAGIGAGAGADGEGALPGGASGLARAAIIVAAVTGEHRYRVGADAILEPLRQAAAASPIAFGGVLAAMSALGQPDIALVVVGDVRDPLSLVAREADIPLTVIVTIDRARALAEAGFALFEGRGTGEVATAYLCHSGVCRRPMTDPSAVRNEIERG